LFNSFILASNEFNSNAMAGKIAYTTPSVMDLMNAPYDAFNGEYLPNGVNGANALDFLLEVHN